MQTLMEDFVLTSRDITKILDMLEAQFGNNCEIVLHDLRKPYDLSLIHI